MIIEFIGKYKIKSRFLKKTETECAINTLLCNQIIDGKIQKLTWVAPGGFVIDNVKDANRVVEEMHRIRLEASAKIK